MLFRSATVREYRRATGMEVLFGYLSVLGQEERLDTLFRIGYGLIEPPVPPQISSHTPNTTEESKES